MLKLGSHYRTIIENRKTYQIGLLQVRAYRILNQRTDELLKNSGITSSQWALLGLIFDNRKEKLRQKDLADLLGVTPPSLTEMMVTLEKKNFATYIKDDEDSRAKLVQITAEGEKFIELTEGSLREGMRPLLRGVALNDIAGYMFVLKNIIENSGSRDP